MSRSQHGSDVYAGHVRSGFEAVAEEFARNLTERGDQGSAFAVFRSGEPLVDLWGGTRDQAGAERWEHGTAAAIYSGTKGLAAACIALLVERGQLDMTAPVCRYWPEFGQSGKGDITVAELLSHRGGLAGLETPVTLEEATRSHEMALLLAKQRPIRRGELSYHALTFGWLCDALIRRIDGRTTGRMFHEEFAGPMNLDIWIGVPARVEVRVAWTQTLAGEASPGAQAEIGSPEWSVWRNPPRVGVEPLPANLRRWRAAEIPASNGVATARSMARLYDLLLSADTARSLLSRETLVAVVSRLADAEEPNLRQRMAFGLGFQLQAGSEPFGPFRAAFGHAGTGGSVHGADPISGLSFSYVTRTLDLSQRDVRASSLLFAVASCLG
ncbi:esterase [Candidatus Protofrankia californiensis]|uniref:Esterase n=1 Tax=Candidatus Protofrankia californiensis TaxID=1839754 RepID=A0A1C3P0N3_9ACTN|nr:esterase [Candidatus Protofrankia californiensis]